MANNRDFDTRGVVTVRAYPVVTGATFKKGDFVIWNGTGIVGIALNTNYAPTTNTTRIVGKCLSDAVNPVSNLNYTHVEVELCQPGTQFPIALPSNVAPALSQLAASYQLKNDANGLPRIDTTQTGTAADAVRVVGFVPSSGTSDNPGWPDNLTGAVNGALAFVEFVAAACAFTGAR